ncbi:MAG: transcription antitermination factor NusB [Alphaproteobacteria bacterium]|jgi:N utilization substance protein B|nr:transcription antitermination factor NusB [Alphaproteobacteria bacterium]
MEHRKSSASARRSAARLAAVQALYQCDMTAIGTEQVLGEFVRFRLGAEEAGEGPLVEPDRALFAAIVRGVARRRSEIDRAIEGALGPQWSFQRLEVLLRMILRAGVWELLENRMAGTRVVIAEYLDLSDAFFTGREPAMVNAVLDRIGRAVRDEGSPFDPAETAADPVSAGRAAEPDGGG